MNQTIFWAISNLSHKNIFLDSLGAFIAHYFPYFIVLALLPFVFGFPDWRKRVFFVGELGLSLILSRGIITNAIRFFYYHPRPFEALDIQALIPESGASFPSGHAAFFFALAMTLFLWNRKWGTVYFGAAILIGLARIFVGVHWPLDILGGAAVGIVSGIIVSRVLKKYREPLFIKKTEEEISVGAI